MKMSFRGLKHEVKPNEHTVPLIWNSALNSSSLLAIGEVNKLRLNGNYQVEFEFEQEELRNWLRKFIASKPEDAIKLLAEMQGEAILSLARTTEQRLSKKTSSTDDDE
jgi:hypothetical protein